MDARLNESAPSESSRSGDGSQSAEAAVPARFEVGQTIETQGLGSAAVRSGTVFGILFAASIAHGLNDLMQSLLPAIYPVLRKTFSLDYGQIGLITLTFQVTASLLQPLVGLSTDRKPRPYSLPVAMCVTLVGLVLLAYATNYTMLLVAAASVGIGSSIFHPEASRVARMASGGRHGLAQSLFQVGGNFGTAAGPLLAAFIVVPRGQTSIAWFTLVAFVGMLLLTRVGSWYATALRTESKRGGEVHAPSTLSRRRIIASVLILLGLIFSKHFYLAGMSTFYTFYLIDKFHVSIQTAQVFLFVFLGAVAAGTIIGGPVGDRVGRKSVIWVSILGVLPFTLALPYADLFWTCALTVVIGLVLASAFSAILVYAQELIPRNVGLVAGLFFGFAFGVAGLGAALLGELADQTSINFVFKVCSFLPLLGVLTFLLPDVENSSKRR
ncbi:MFS transporter [Lichenihabitans psoromatis]|uniref:MFS transporter n=1 Tax=Lichenihabitans psoromatis TaxID=2528642 RepID=UPI001036B0F1|nr:MFS transporter [Lichenihabitans psoromatis]